MTRTSIISARATLSGARTCTARRFLGRFPTPVVNRLRDLSPTLWIKRDDLCGNPMGGNKVRALEFLLGDVKAEEREQYCN